MKQFYWILKVGSNVSVFNKLRAWCKGFLPALLCLRVWYRCYIHAAAILCFCYIKLLSSLDKTLLLQVQNDRPYVKIAVRRSCWFFKNEQLQGQILAFYIVFLIIWFKIHEKNHFLILHHSLAKSGPDIIYINSHLVGLHLCIHCRMKTSLFYSRKSLI